MLNGALYFIGVKTTAWLTAAFKVPLLQILLNVTPKDGHLEAAYRTIASLPVTRSTCATYKNHLLSVGGVRNNLACDDILCYDEESDKWVLIGRIPTPRYRCLVEVVDSQLVVVGGWFCEDNKCNLVEIGTLSIS